MSDAILRPSKPRRVLSTVVMIVAITLAAPATRGHLPPVTVDPAGTTLTATAHLGAKRYVAAGNRAYVIGTENGSFAPMGWHMTGQMGGVWMHPIKWLDGYWFQVNSHWLTDATSFTSGPGYVQMKFPSSADIQVTSTEFSPDGIPAVLAELSMSNDTPHAQAVSLKLVARSELMSAYPWDFTTPTAASFNRPDAGSYSAKTGILTFHEQGKPWYAMVQGSLKPLAGGAGARLWGPVGSAQQNLYEQDGRGTGGRLTWRLSLPAHGRKDIWLAVAGSQVSRDAARSALASALADPDTLLAQKLAGRIQTLRRTVVSTPDHALDTAFDWSKMNLADLRRTVTDVHVRATADGSTYPAPAAKFASLAGIGAGFPDYPWFFGTDGAYSTYALVASGQWQTAINQLTTIRKVSQAVNGSTGKVIHEMVTDGSVYYGLNGDAGDTNETAEFAMAVYLVWQWTGEKSFLASMYPFVKAGLRYITSKRMDGDGDGWPEGSGMVETSGMGSSTVDVAAYTWEALNELEVMAAAESDSSEEKWAMSKAAWFQKHFDTAWWVSSQGVYADSICSAGDTVTVAGCSAEGQKLQQKYWTDATPMETGLAPVKNAEIALTHMQSSVYTGPNGVYQAGIGGGSGGQGDLRVWTLPTGVMAAAEAAYGRPDQALRYVDDITRLLTLEMPGALPEMAPGAAYDPFQPMTSRAMFMQAWSSYGVQWPLIHGFLGIIPDAPASTVSVVPDLPSSWPSAAVSNMKIGSGAMNVSTTRSGKTLTTTVTVPPTFNLVLGQILPPAARVASVTLNGRAVSPSTVSTTRGPAVEIEVPASTVREYALIVTLG